ncbi:MAG: DNA repair protein RadC [Anaerolineae bacterium]|nr:DNA repair protein RadC [Anaerolineae bacterium]
MLNPDPLPLGPYQRLMQQGASALSNAELLAVLLRSGQGEVDASLLGAQVLTRLGGLGGLARATLPDLLTLEQLSPAKVALLAAATELARRMTSVQAPPPQRVFGAEDAARLVSAEMETLKQEHFRVILLDVHRQVMAIPTIYIGSLQMTVVRPAEVFREAIVRNCAALVLVHNHPSGDPTPSRADLEVTQELIVAGRLLDILVLDHVIIGHGRWVSLREVGVVF